MVHGSWFFVTSTIGSSSDVSLLQDDAVLCKEQICGSGSNGKLKLCIAYTEFINGGQPGSTGGQT